CTRDYYGRNWYFDVW
nr:immunoglobulin heavy chain junction region [Mus musculus]